MLRRLVSQAINTSRYSLLLLRLRALLRDLCRLHLLLRGIGGGGSGGGRSSSSSGSRGRHIERLHVGIGGLGVVVLGVARNGGGGGWRGAVRRGVYACL